MSVDLGLEIARRLRYDVDVALEARAFRQRRSTLPSSRKKISLSLNHQVVELIALARENPSSDDLIERQIEGRIRELRLETINSYISVIDDQTRIGRKLHQRYIREIANKGATHFWVYGKKTAGELEYDQIAVSQSILKALEAHSLGLPQVKFSELVVDLRKKCDDHNNIVKYMSEALKENVKYKDDRWRARATTIALILAVFVAVLGQSRDAYNNGKLILSYIRDGLDYVCERPTFRSLFGPTQH